MISYSSEKKDSLDENAGREEDIEVNSTKGSEARIGVGNNHSWSELFTRNTFVLFTCEFFYICLSAKVCFRVYMYITFIISQNYLTSGSILLVLTIHYFRCGGSIHRRLHERI